MWFILLALLAISCGGQGGNAENFNSPVDNNNPANPLATPIVGQGFRDCRSSDVQPFGSEIIRQVCVDPATGNQVIACFNADGDQVACP